MRIPASLASAPPAWLSAVPALVDDLVARWDLDLGGPFDGGTCSWVAPAGDLVLKVTRRHEENRDEARGLKALADHGAVRVHRVEDLGDTTAMLLERCRPGRPLSERPELEQDTVIAGLITRFREVVAPPLRPLSEMCDAWAAETDLPDIPLVRDGLAVLRELPRSATSEVLLCTDLHAGNVLSGERLPWLLIDPKPYVGDPHFEPVQHLLNCQERWRADPLGLVRRLADLTELNAERLCQWAFARLVQGGVLDLARALAP